MNSLLNPIVRGDYACASSGQLSDNGFVYRQRWQVGYPAQQLLQLTISPPWYKNMVVYTRLYSLVAVIIIESVRRVLKRKEEKLRWEMKET